MALTARDRPYGAVRAAVLIGDGAQDVDMTAHPAIALTSTTELSSRDDVLSVLMVRAANPVPYFRNRAVAWAG